MSNQRVEVLLCIQQALLGEVFPALRAIDISWGEKMIKFIAYVDGIISDNDYDSLSCIETEIIACFSENYIINYEIIRIDSPHPLPNKRGMECVYSRREISSSIPKQ
ncbi:MAG: hypothetical protein ACD_19C00418G0002 [uncultured bacterium]|nr:MAG: hypothetical protein ACD_19C00418G0002 [uncultured bacterium]